MIGKTGRQRRKTERLTENPVRASENSVVLTGQTRRTRRGDTHVARITACRHPLTRIGMRISDTRTDAERHKLRPYGHCRKSAGQKEKRNIDTARKTQSTRRGDTRVARITACRHPLTRIGMRISNTHTDAEHHKLRPHGHCRKPAGQKEKRSIDTARNTQSTRRGDTRVARITAGTIRKAMFY